MLQNIISLFYLIWYLLKNPHKINFLNSIKKNINQETAPIFSNNFNLNTYFPISEPFDGKDQELKSTITKVIKNFQPFRIIETGTHTGNTTRFFAKFNIQIETIEISRFFYLLSRNRLIENYKNINFYLGNSSEVIKQFNDFHIKTFVFIDAHGYEYSLPVIEELSHLSKFEEIIILIDDFKDELNPNTSFSVYKNGASLSYDYLKNYLDGFNLYFRKPKTNSSNRDRGIVILSKKHYEFFNDVNLELFKSRVI